MPLSPNSQLLVEKIESIQLLNDRFEKMKLINKSPENEKRGCFSLIFYAHDILRDAPVALKFYDIDPALITDDYRRACFRREHEILQVLVDKNRCLQLTSQLSTYPFVLQIGPEKNATLPCEYFAMEWIEDDIDDYFFRQETYSPVDKLNLFNELTLGVEALHRHEIFHRDLKPDNLRKYQKALKRVVVAIDLGTAARFTSPNIQKKYQHPVGATGYASPEAASGLAGHRKLAPYSDYYALGCMLYELFNLDIFYSALLAKNPKHHGTQAIMSFELQGKTNEADKLAAWELAIRKFSSGFEPVRIDGTDTSAPPGVAHILNEVLRSLTHINFSNRPKNLEWVRNRIWSAIRTLENEKLYQRKLAFSKKVRQKRIEKQRQKSTKLEAFIKSKKQLC